MEDEVATVTQEVRSDEESRQTSDLPVINPLEPLPGCSNTHPRSMRPLVTYPESDSSTTDTEKTSRITDIEQDLKGQRYRRLEMLKVPPVLKQRGRPKGADKTIIGLTKKNTKVVTRRTPFCKLREKERIQIMLGWFVSQELVKSASQNRIEVDESEVEVRPDKVTSAVLDGDVNFDLLRSYFTPDAWLLLSDVVESKRRNPTWACEICTVDLNETLDENIDPNLSTHLKKECIRCDLCLSWFHFKCVALKKTPKANFWYCSKCQGHKK